jgi:hypothetical protein
MASGLITLFPPETYLAFHWAYRFFNAVVSNVVILIPAA